MSKAAGSTGSAPRPRGRRTEDMRLRQRSSPDVRILATRAKLPRSSSRGGSMRVLGTAGAVMLAVLALSAGAGAITYGVPDGNGHPAVGALLAQQPYSDGTW